MLLKSPDLVRCFLDNVDSRGDHVCLRFLSDDPAEPVEITFSQLALDASAFAVLYQQNGLESGDLVLIFLDHHSSMYASFMGAMMMGCIPSFMPCPSPNQDPARYWSSHKKLMERILPKAVVTTKSHGHEMNLNGLFEGHTTFLDVDLVPSVSKQFVPGFLDPDQAAFLQHSSGTTSLKKGVALSHKAVINQVNSYAATLGLSPDETIVSWLPIYHDMGLIACMITPLMVGQTTIMMAPLKWAMRPVMLFEAIQAYQGRYVWMPNFAFEHLCKTVVDLSSDIDLSGVAAFISCSEPCKLETIDRFVDKFAASGVKPSQMQTCYALAENVFAATQTRMGSHPKGAKPNKLLVQEEGEIPVGAALTSSSLTASVGRPVPGVEIYIRNEKGEFLADGEVGEIILAGTSLFDGYFKQADVTADRLSDGYFATRDMGFIRDQELYVLGRMDDLIIANGKNFYAHDLEAIVSDIEGVKPGRCVAFGVFNEDLGSEEVVIVAQSLDISGGHQPKLKRAIKKSIFDDCGLIIKESRIVGPDWLVKTTSGKISRDANRSKYISEVKAT